MKPRPRLLDLFSGAGGAAMGYHRAGFEVVGVDIAPQRYPFEFHQADAMTFPLDGFDAIHASPPCQAYSALRTVLRDGHGTAWMLTTTIERLEGAGLPYVVENVPGARAGMGDRWVSVCGASLGLRTDSAQRGEAWLRRHRLFASNIALLVSPCACRPDRKIIGVYGHGDGGGRGWKGSFADRKAVMGIDWMNRAELAQAIPPAYTEHVGAQLLEHLGVAA